MPDIFVTSLNIRLKLSRVLTTLDKRNALCASCVSKAADIAAAQDATDHNMVLRPGDAEFLLFHMDRLALKMPEANRLRATLMDHATQSVDLGACSCAKIAEAKEQHARHLRVIGQSVAAGVVIGGLISHIALWSCSGCHPGSPEWLSVVNSRTLAISAWTNFVGTIFTLIVTFLPNGRK